MTEDEWFMHIEAEQKMKRRLDGNKPASLLLRMVRVVSSGYEDIRGNFSLPEGTQLKYADREIIKI